MKNKNKAQPGPRAKFYVDTKGRFVHDAVMFMLLSAVFRVVGCWGLWNDKFFAVTEIMLPLAAAILFALFLRFLGDRAFPATILPVMLGLVFFIFRALHFENVLYTVICIGIYVLAAALYTMTALGIIRTKWLLVPLFALPFIYRVAVVDIAALRDTADPVLFSEGMQELSVLSIMLALLFTALAMKKRKLLEEAGLPKIKDPVVIKPAKPGQTAAAAEQSTAAESADPAEPAAVSATAETSSVMETETAQAENLS